MSDDNNPDDYKDPALKHFNRTSFIAKNTVIETIKGAAMGALIGAVIFAVFAAAIPLLGLAAIPVVGPILASATAFMGLTGGLGAGVLAGAAATGALWGGGIGALAKGGMALSNANEIADNKEELIIQKTQNFDLNQRRMAAIKTQQARTMQKGALDSQTAMLRAPNVGPQGRQGSMQMDT